MGQRFRFGRNKFAGLKNVSTTHRIEKQITKKKAVFSTDDKTMRFAVREKRREATA